MTESKIPYGNTEDWQTQPNPKPSAMVLAVTAQRVDKLEAVMRNIRRMIAWRGDAGPLREYIDGQLFEDIYKQCEKALEEKDGNKN